MFLIKTNKIDFESERYRFLYDNKEKEEIRYVIIDNPLDREDYKININISGMDEKKVYRLLFDIVEANKEFVYGRHDNFYYRFTLDKVKYVIYKDLEVSLCVNDELYKCPMDLYDIYYSLKNFGFQEVSDKRYKLYFVNPLYLKADEI